MLIQPDEENMDDEHSTKIIDKADGHYIHVWVTVGLFLLVLKYLRKQNVVGNILLTFESRLRPFTGG